MPTGYTDVVADGSVTEFYEFIMRCARAFGALINMREESMNATIPDHFEPDISYYDRELEKAASRLSELRMMSLPAVREAAQQAYATEVTRYENRIDREGLKRSRYEAMLAHVEAWQPPTDDHFELKEFMKNQLEESVRFDCTPLSYEQEPVKIEPDAWLAEQVADAERDVAYYQEAKSRKSSVPKAAIAGLRT